MSRPLASEHPFRAVADGTRRRIIDLLQKGDRSALELARLTNMSRPTLSHHLGILRIAGLITQQREGRRRKYRFNPDALRGPRMWINEKTVDGR